MKMTNARTTIWVMAIVLSVASSPVLGLIDFADGGTHDIDYEIHDTIRVDYQAPGMQTTVNLLDGGSTLNLRAYKDSIVNILGGSIAWNLSVYDSSQVDISGGSIGLYLWSHGFSQVDISGGSIGIDLHALDSSQVSFSGGSSGGKLWAHGFSQVDISGGSIKYGLLSTDSAILTIHGSDFAVDGAPFGYGELTSIYGGHWQDEPYSSLSGTLASGEPIGNSFRIGYDAKIVLIPAPGTFVLGSIGLAFTSWKLRKRKEL